MAKKDPTPDFESSLEELETLVEQMESGDLTLEKSLQQFERGMALTKTCQEALSAAQLRVDTLLESPEEAGDSAVEDTD
ncbi:MAG: exodeoxyribonuclease VII small subunit [Lysobacterales bacterium]